MTFTSPLYPVFLLAVVLLYWLAVRLRVSTLGLLLGASFLFYASWNPFYCVALAASAAVDYNVTRAMAATADRGRRGLLVTASLVFDLGLLATLKYFNLFAGTAAKLWGALGRGPVEVPFSLLFAAGISFYTFQSLSLVIDVYRGDSAPARSYLEHLAFMAFFPTLLAGPITRGETLLPQLRAPRPALDADQAGRGLFLIALGMVKKLIIADYLAMNLVDRVFDLPGMYSSLEVLAGAYGYAVQIYCDFSGYSDMAIGSALLLGIALKDNFNSPYRSADIAEFWRRWHISFSQWLRDYLFFSLPGKRPGTIFPYLNLVITFALGGLWHGASWTYLVWGALQGLGLALYRFLQERRRKPGRPSKRPAWRTALGVFLTFHFVTATWIFFRSPDLARAGEIFARLGRLSFGWGNLSPLLLLAMAAGLVPQFLPEGWYRRLADRFVALPAYAQAAALAAVFVAVRLAAGTAPAPFIYFSY